MRQDDHADDERTDPDVTFHVGQVILGRIDSDIGPDDTHPNAWGWAETADGNAVPRWGIESADDKDVFRFEVSKAGTYAILMDDGPKGVGIWAIWHADGTGQYVSYEAPLDAWFDDLQPGTHYFAVGTLYLSEGNTGEYTVLMNEVAE